MTIDMSFLIGLLLFLSIGLNILLIWFLRGITSRLVLVSNNMSDLVDHIVRYGSNLKSVYEMELYYGDETMQALIKHTQMILEILSDFEEIYALTDDEDQDEADEETDEEEEELDGDQKDPESPQEETETQVQRKAVFYSGP